MWKKTIAVVGASAAIVGGAGTAALAASGTTTPTPPASASGLASEGTVSDSTVSDSTVSESAAGGLREKAGRHQRVNRLRRAVHATWVSENKTTRAFVTHDAIRGRVTAVSPTSITVAAADTVTQTYLVNAATKVHARASKSAASISDVKIGDPVFVGGTGTTTLTAVRILDAKK